LSCINITQGLTEPSGSVNKPDVLQVSFIFGSAAESIGRPFAQPQAILSHPIIHTAPQSEIPPKIAVQTKMRSVRSIARLH
jgi:hypothetical protein